MKAFDKGGIIMKYNQAEVKVTYFEQEDVITTSSPVAPPLPGSGDGNGGDASGEPFEDD